MSQIKKFNVMVLMLIISIIISGCAHPENDMAGGNNAINEIENKQQETHYLEENQTMQNNVIKNITVDNGSHVCEVYGSGEYVFSIDADVSISDGDIKQGKLAFKDIKIDLIEQVLCGDSKLIATEIPGEYVTNSNNSSSDLGYDMAYYSLDNMSVFENFTIDLQGYDAVNVESHDWTEQERAFVSSMERKSSEILDNLNLKKEYSHVQLQRGSKNIFCSVYFNCLLNNLPVISKELYMFLQSNVTLDKQGISNIHFMGLYEIEESQEVNILSLDEVLTIVKMGVEEKNINTQPYTINKIELAYMVDETDNSFYPVWCFAYCFAEDLGNLPCLCINAQTGEVEYM